MDIKQSVNIQQIPDATLIKEAVNRIKDNPNLTKQVLEIASNSENPENKNLGRSLDLLTLNAKSLKDIKPNQKTEAKTKEVLATDTKSVAVLNSLLTGQGIKDGALATLGNLVNKLKGKSVIENPAKMEDVLGVLKAVLDTAFKPESSPKPQAA
ncbi:MAG: hypothetical protein HRT47_07420 [Candidatus Caenarcaniphilales bacterium]|nr:hypothetical protein [Candidatus Caenarcaniphilales bacterium]